MICKVVFILRTFPIVELTEVEGIGSFMERGDVFLGISRVPNYKLRNISVFILVYGSKVGCQVSNNGKILPISCAWQESAKHTKLAAIHNFGRLNNGTHGKHTKKKINGNRTHLWQNSANFVPLAGFCQVREFGSRTQIWQK